jgi:hypothetical protein
MLRQLAYGVAQAIVDLLEGNRRLGNADNLCNSAVNHSKPGPGESSTYQSNSQQNVPVHLKVLEIRPLESGLVQHGRPSYQS